MSLGKKFEFSYESDPGIENINNKLLQCKWIY